MTLYIVALGGGKREKGYHCIDESEGQFIIKFIYLNSSWIFFFTSFPVHTYYKTTCVLFLLSLCELRFRLQAEESMFPSDSVKKKYNFLKQHCFITNFKPKRQDKEHMSGSRKKKNDLNLFRFSLYAFFFFF